MNRIQIQLLLSWLLIIVWSIVLYCHHPFIAWLLFGAGLLSRMGLPPRSHVFKKIGRIVTAGLILILVLVMIHSYHPFPPQLVKVGEVAGIIFCVIVCPPLVIRGIYEDCMLLRGSKNAKTPGSLHLIILSILLAWSTPALSEDINDAARTGDLVKVQALLKRDPTLVSNAFLDSWTPLCEAADNGYYDIAKVLVANHADVNVKAKGGRSPLYLATMYGDNNIVQLLLGAGADANGADDNGVTPLHLAAWNNYKKAALLLLAAGADVNARNKGGETPLDWATKRGNKGMIKWLLAKGAKP
jgi:Ankyrin repeats (3 copies)